jgi:hypothetical protein
MLAVNVQSFVKARKKQDFVQATLRHYSAKKRSNLVPKPIRCAETLAYRH